MDGDLKRQRGAKKAAVTRIIGSIDRFIAEKKTPKVKESYDKLMEAFDKFAELHERYHETIETDEEVEESDKYFLDYQKIYIDALTRAQDFVGEKDNNIKPDPEVKPSSVDVLNLVNLPKVELDIFDGDPMQYHNFMAIFDEHVGNTPVNDSMKLTRLLQYTSGDAKKAIRPCVHISGSGGYAKAREILEKRCGDRHIITDAVIKSLRNGQPVKSASDLQQLSDELVNCCTTLKSMERMSEIDTQTSIVDISNRLQPYIRNRWRRRALEAKRDTNEYPGFEEFVKFVAMESEEANDPIYGHTSNVKFTSSSSNSKSAKSRSSSSCFSLDLNKSSNSRRTLPPCILCKQDHRLFHCQQFKSMKLQEAIRCVKDIGFVRTVFSQITKRKTVRIQ